MSRARCLITMLCLIGCAACLAACGSSSSSSSGGASQTSGAGGGNSTASGSAAAAGTGSPSAFVSPAIAAQVKSVNGIPPLGKPATMSVLKSRVALYESVPKNLLTTAPVTKKATPGKNIVMLVCGVPVCSQYADATQQAATLLGWKLTRVPSGVSPEQFVQAYTQAIADKPDLVIGSGVPRSVINDGLTKLAQLHIPTIQFAAGITAEPSQGLYTADTAPLYAAVAIQASEAVALDGDMKSNMVIFNVPQYPENTRMSQIISQYLPKICSGCSVDIQTAAATDIGSLGQKVTSYLQSHPSTKYVMCAFGDLCQGVGAAVRSAGFSDVKILSRDSSTTNFQNIANGLEWAASPLPTAEVGWQLIDMAQRIFNKQSVANTSTAQRPVFVTKVPNPKSSTVGTVPNYQALYKKLWKLG
jgi:ABC-type sugar transport system substrate-binding protein